MPETTSHAPGAPCWVDMGSPDIAASVTFYAGLFGWECFDTGEETGHYTMAYLGDKMVAAIGPAMSPGPPHWATYFAVTSCDETASAISASGGTVVAPPMDVMDVGRMAVAQDPAGGFFSLWQPGTHPGFGVVQEPGAYCWTELNVRELDKAVPFYESLFGWTTMHDTEPMEYREFQLDGQSVAGCLVMGAEFPPHVPTNWLVYFATADVEATCAKATELGGVVVMEGYDTPAGRFAVLADPQGAVFSVIAWDPSGVSS